MTLEKVIWTALPHGVDEEGSLRLSVHVAPRLRNADGSDVERVLEEFPAFSRWPERLAELEMDVELDDGSIIGTAVDRLADVDLWTRILPPDTPVRPHAFPDHSTRDVHAFPVRSALAFLEDAYGRAAAAGTELPSLDDVLGPLGPFLPLGTIPDLVGDSRSFYEELARAYEGDRSPGRVVSEDVAQGLPPDQRHAVNTMFRAYRFYHRPGSQRPDLPADLIEGSPAPPRFDAHEILAALADHPLLLRRLGIVIDLSLHATPPDLPATGALRLVLHGELPEDPPLCPWTSYDLEDRWFGASPRDPFRLSYGQLRLSPEVYDVFQVDVDGAALQAVGFGSTLAALTHPDRRTEGRSDEAALPSLRGGGLAIARTHRGEALLEDLSDRAHANDALEAGEELTWHAEDLVRGYRVDVHDEDAADGPRWFSLLRRVTTHVIAAGDGGRADRLELADEGYLKATSATSETAEHPNASTDLYLHETVFGWEGWSLAAPRPGKRVVEPGAGDDGSSIAQHDPAEGNPFPITSSVAVEPGTLPRLRLGHTYRMRARTVDIAGNSVPFREEDLEPGDPDLASEPQAYVRFEPVPSPTLLRRHHDTEGESLEHLVIRSAIGTSAEGYASRPAVREALADAPHRYAGSSERHLAPPKTSQLMAEQDGAFDDAFGGPPAAVASALHVALKEEGTFLDELVVDTASGQRTIPQSTIALHPPSASLPHERGAGLDAGAYAYHPDAEVVLPYLPDRLAIGVVLIGRDVTGAEVISQIAHFPGSWPHLACFRLRVVEGPLGVNFDDVLEVRLPKAEVIRARLASVFPDDRLEDLAIWRWVPPAQRTDELRGAAVRGRHRMLTPSREVILTHAVDQPLAVPDMTQVRSTRAPRATFARFRGPITNHARSTGRLDIIGEWTEDVDLLTDDAPRMRATDNAVVHHGPAFGFDVRPTEDAAEVSRHDARHEFGDTKHRRVTYHSVATTRFREYFALALTEDPAAIQQVEPTTDPQGADRPELVHVIPSSARPSAPEVEYVLPTFRWQRDDADPARRTHRRQGKAVRVWLRRPWFSSGDGEQLAVVLAPAAGLPPGWERLPLDRIPREVPVMPQLGRVSQQASAELRASLVGDIGKLPLEVVPTKQPTSAQVRAMLTPYVTDWGSDPVWRSATPALPPSPGAFPLRTGTVHDLTLDELPRTVTVAVAAHAVHFDPGRKLWYADIEVAAGDSYFPFLRLALARYQPSSLPDAHLSRVVMTDFVQLPPDRVAEVLPVRDGVRVTVRGYSGRNAVADAGRLPWLDEPGPRDATPNTTVRVALERRTPGVPGDLGWERVGAETTLNASASGSLVTWSSTVAVPREALGAGSHRLVLTEVESHLRDIIAGDPGLASSPTDFVRERIVYADVFDL